MNIALKDFPPTRDGLLRLRRELDAVKKANGDRLSGESALADYIIDCFIHLHDLLERRGAING